jgi:hypothetical protein
MGASAAQLSVIEVLGIDVPPALVARADRVIE